MHTAAMSNNILLVGSSQAEEAILSMFRDQPWVIHSVRSPTEALRSLRNDTAIDIVLLVPGQNLDPHLELCRAIKLDERTNMVAVVCFLDRTLDNRAADIYAAGADDCIRSVRPSGRSCCG